MTRKTRSGRMLPAALLLLAATAAANETERKLLASDGAPGDSLGFAVDADERTVVAGAWMASSAGTQTGVAYVYDAVNGTQRMKLTASDGNAFDAYGNSVAVSGRRVLVGAPYADGGGTNFGGVYVYDAFTGAELERLYADDGEALDDFGWVVDVDGPLAVVGAPSNTDNGPISGSAYVFDLETGAQLCKLLPDDGAAFDAFGSAVAVRDELVLVGALFDDDNGPASGSAYLFDARTGAQLAKVQPDDGSADAFFGSSVALNGSIALIGARSDYQNGPHAGAAYLFELGTLHQTAKLLPLDGYAGQNFGSSVALGQGVAVIGAPQNNVAGPQSGAVYRFDVATGRQMVRVLPTDLGFADYLGTAVAVSGETAVATAPGDDDQALDAGAVYLFDAQATVAQSYCTAGVSASGCTATLSTAGLATASGTIGFTISARSVEGAKDGAFYFGINGRQATPWGNGSSYQCVLPPVERTGILEGSGAPGFCGGAFDLDLNTFWADEPAKHPGAGAVVQAQLWYRDPANTSNRATSLSDAVEFTVCP